MVFRKAHDGQALGNSLKHHILHGRFRVAGKGRVKMAVCIDGHDNSPLCFVERTVEVI